MSTDRVPVSDEVLLEELRAALRGLLDAKRVTMWRSDVASISADELRRLLDGDA
jgi:hypothetical protein